MRTHRMAMVIGLWWVAAAIVLCTLLSLTGCAEKCGARERVVCARELVYISGSVPIYGRVCHCEPDGAK